MKEQILDKIAELMGQSGQMKSYYGNEDNVAYACGMVDLVLFTLLRYVEELDG